MNKTVVIIAAIIVLAVAGGAIYMNSSRPTPQQPENNTAMTAEPTTVMEATKEPEESGEPAETNQAEDDSDKMAAVKEFTVTGSNFSFDPKEIKVKKGDKVKVTFKNADGFHDFRIDEFDVATKQIKGGEQETVEFTADKAGTFEYYCSVGKHREMGMVGKLIVQ